MSEFLLQMAGRPGSGKSALARLVARGTSAVVLDKDVLKTAVLDCAVDESRAGPIAYECFFALADHLLGQGLSVVLDSPSFWPAIPTKGEAIAVARMVPYYFIECICDDREELTRRLQERVRLRSNPGVEALQDEHQTIGPSGAFLRIDTTQPIERCYELALDYVGRG